MTIAYLNNDDGAIQLNGFPRFRRPIIDTGALPCIMTRDAWMLKEARPKVYSVHSLLQTVAGRIQHPLGESELIEITFRAGSNGQVVRRLIPFLILERGGYDVLFGMSLGHNVYANLDWRTETTMVYTCKTGTVFVTSEIG